MVCHCCSGFDYTYFSEGDDDECNSGGGNDGDGDAGFQCNSYAYRDDIGCDCGCSDYVGSDCGGSDGDCIYIVVKALWR